MHQTNQHEQASHHEHMSRREHYEEKRSFIRMRIEAQARFHPASNPQPVSATCVNLSSTGLLIETQQAFRPGQTGIVSLGPEGMYTKLEAEVIIRRCIKTKTGYHIGLEIERMLH